VDDTLMHTIFLAVALWSFSCAIMGSVTGIVTQNMPWHSAFFVFFQMATFFGVILWAGWRQVRKATYVLTDRRLMHIKQFVIHQFEWSAFTRAEQNKNADGTAIIQLFTEHSVAPNVVLVLAASAEKTLSHLPAPVQSHPKQLPSVSESES
jgi:hypothetical protein